MGPARTTNDSVIAVVQENAASLMRLARRHSLCDDDAADAYQRAIEIYLGRAERVDGARAGAWLRTVCKHEAMRIRAARQRVLPAVEVAWDTHPSLDARELDERAASLERVARAAEALAACKPDEVRAMLLKADGSSYAEIGELFGWTHTKVNRCLVEGRARFLRHFSAIESGAACDHYSPVLSSIVDGEATPDDFARLRPHLRHCVGCRATLKAMYASEPALKALLPAGALVLAVPDPGGALVRAYESVAAGLGDLVVRAHAVLEAVTSTKTAAVMVSTAAMAAGGAAAVDRTADTADAASPGAVRALPRPARRAAARVAAARVPATATPTPTPALAPPAVTPEPAPDPTPTPSATATPAASPEFTIERPARTAPRTAGSGTAAPGTAASGTAPQRRRGSAGGGADEFAFEG